MKYLILGFLFFCLLNIPTFAGPQFSFGLNVPVTPAPVVPVQPIPVVPTQPVPVYPYSYPYGYYQYPYSYCAPGVGFNFGWGNYHRPTYRRWHR